MNYYRVHYRPTEPEVDGLDDKALVDACLEAWVISNPLPEQDARMLVHIAHISRWPAFMEKQPVQA